MILLAAALCSGLYAKTFHNAFDFQGHRGVRGVYAENTIPAFNYAAEMGVTTLELDVQLTKDYVPVVSHNPVLHSYMTKDYRGRWIEKGKEPVISQLMHREIGQYYVGECDPASNYYKQHYQGMTALPKIPVPTLEDVLLNAERLGYKHLRFNIEIKHYADGPNRIYNPPSPEIFVQSVMEVVRKCRVQDRTTIQSFDWRVLAECRRLYKDEVLLAALTEEGPETYYRQEGAPGCSPWMAGLDIDDYNGNYVLAAKDAHADVISPRYDEVTADMVRHAHEQGMKIIPFTVNEREDMIRMIDMGVDGIITDKVELLKSLLVERSINI